MSGEHAVIVTILNDSFLEDLGSTNGTLVNGKPVKKHFLQNNDVIELGKYKLKYIGEAPAAAAAAAADFEKTMVLRPGGDEGRCRAGHGGAGAAAAAHAAPRSRAAARAVAGAAAGQAAQPSATPQPVDAALRRLAAAAAGAGRSQPLPRAAAAPPAGPAAGRDPDPVGRQCRQGARAHQAAHHAGQAGRAGGGDHAPAAGLLHHPRRGRQLPDRERQGDRHAQAHALKDHDMIELAGVKMEFFLKT